MRRMEMCEKGGLPNGNSSKSSTYTRNITETYELISNECKSATVDKTKK
jgi:hypothetical protein